MGWTDSQLEWAERVLDRNVGIDDFLERRVDTSFLPELNMVVAANGELFHLNKKGFFPRILEDKYAERKKAKAAMIESEELYERTKDKSHESDIARWKNVDKGSKVQLNAAYGVLTNIHFSMYDFNNAEAITTSGQLAIRWIERHVNEFLNRTLSTDGVDYIIAMDTDSIYVNFGPLVSKVMSGRSRDESCAFLVRLADGKMEEVIEEGYVELARMVNSREQKMKMKRETVADRGIWTGKKHYILNCLDKEGVRYSSPKLEIKGMAAVKSSTPSGCRERIKDAIKVIMNGDEEELSRFVQDFRDGYERLPFGEMAKPSSVSEIEKWEDPVTLFRTGTPLQVRASILYNRIIRARGLTEYPEISNGDKIKMVYLRTPNPISQNVFGTPGPIPPGVALERYIDYDDMFEKTFMTPLRSILDAIGWRIRGRDSASLDDFFG